MIAGLTGLNNFGKIAIGLSLHDYDDEEVLCKLH